MTMQSVAHYENFPVASWLCPPRLRPPIQALYHFARTADDLADEGNATAKERINALQNLRHDLLSSLDDPLYQSLHWPDMLVALQSQVMAFHLPVQPLLNLLDAFEQDVRYTEQGKRYENRNELLEYCKCSANPIGRLLLHLYGMSDNIALQQSDAICSALQLINFWQDLSEDLPRGRLYLPMHTSLAEELQFARQMMMEGAPLVHQLPGRAGWELRFVVQGGLRILDKIERTNTYVHKPRLSLPDVLLMAWRACWMPQSKA